MFAVFLLHQYDTRYFGVVNCICIITGINITVPEEISELIMRHFILKGNIFFLYQVKKCPLEVHSCFIGNNNISVYKQSNNLLIYVNFVFIMLINNLININRIPKL